jgi:transposase
MQSSRPIKLGDRNWTCACGAHHDRDVNAAINLEEVAREHRETQNACGGDVRPGVRKDEGLFPAKQELALG